MKLGLIPFLVLVLIGLMINIVYAQDEEELNLLDLPKNLANALGIPEYPAKLLASACVMLLFMVPVLMLTNNLYAILMMGLITMGVLIGIGWLDFWFILVIVLIVACLWGSKMAKIGGR